MKPRHIAMGVALAGAAALVIFGDKTPNDSVAEAVVRAPSGAPAAATGAPRAGGAGRVAGADGAPAGAAPRAGVGAAAAAGKGDVAILRLVPREELIGAVGDGAFKSMDGVFGGASWNPPPPPPQENVQAAPPPPPSAPPLPFQLIGKAAADGQWEVYLSRGEQTFVVRKGTTIEGTYRVEAIAPPTMSITYLPMNQVQQLHIGVIE